MKHVMATLAVTLAVILIGAAVFFMATPTGQAIWNGYQHTLQKTDDATLYQTRKKVEDTCRAMQASYESDRRTWEQYRNSDSAERSGWADQAMMRANKTAASYNEYVLKNSYVWEGNVPSDIRGRLEYLEAEP